MWVHGRCAREKRVTPKFSRNYACRKYELNVEVRLCDEIEKVRDFSYLGARVSAFGGCEAAVIARKDVGG